MANETIYQSSLTELESKFKKNWSNIRKAREAAFEKREEVKTFLYANGQKFASGDTSLVVFGSLARDEWTPKSDLDWGYLIDAQAHPEHLTVAQKIAGLFEEHKLGENPGQLAFLVT